jgi:hypothetical protein
MGLEEQPLDSDELSRLLDERETAKEALKPYRVAFRDLNILAKAQIDRMELGNGLYRCGDFVVEIKPVESRTIEFERTARKSVSIRPAKT